MMPTSGRKTLVANYDGGVVEVCIARGEPADWEIMRRDQLKEGAAWHVPILESVRMSLDAWRRWLVQTDEYIRTLGEEKTMTGPLQPLDRGEFREDMRRATEPIDTTNAQIVGTNGADRITVMMPKTVMTKEEALCHAAWLVMCADLGSRTRFNEIFEAILRT